MLGILSIRKRKSRIKYMVSSAKGKLFERKGRKAMGLKLSKP